MLGQTALNWHNPATATSNVTGSRNAMSGLAYLRKWRDYHFAPQHGSNNFFNIGIACHHFREIAQMRR
jgi:hypothetical protein